MGDKGFTLVELLVVISMLTLVSGGVYAYSASARERAFDAVQLAETAEIKKAAEIYSIQSGDYPPNFSSTIAREGSVAYEQSMQVLVDAELLPEVPQSPRGDAYYYYNFGPNVLPYIGSAQYDLDDVNFEPYLIHFTSEVDFGEEGEILVTPKCVTPEDFDQCIDDYGWGPETCLEDSSLSLPQGNYEFYDEQSDRQIELGWYADYCPYPISL